MISQTVRKFFDNLNASRILVIGDVMLDTYIKGNSTRISPESPVPVINNYYEEYKLGGAGNVVSNMIDYVEHIDLIGIYGSDKTYEHIRSLVTSNDVVHNIPIFADRDNTENKHFRTTNKTRIIANGQQVARLDEETVINEYGGVHDAIFERFIEHSHSGRDIRAVVLSDYNKGTLPEKLIQAIIGECHVKGIPVLIDPKINDPIKYRGATLLKPNKREFEDLIDNKLKSLGDISEEIVSYKNKYAHDYVYVTLGDDGVAYNINDKLVYVPANRSDVIDVTGAGDTVLAILAIGMAAGKDMCEVGKAANWAASIVCGQQGTTSIRKSVIERELEISDGS